VRDHGADGFVTGALTKSGALDESFLQRMLDAAGALPITFHRAFDVCAKPLEVFDRLLELGVQRLLTSGQAPRVEEGADLLADLVQRAGDRMVVMPGGGLREETAAALAARVQAHEYHGSASRPVAGPLEFPARVADESRVARL
ncbi:MAG: copper homeostasis protein CutC, partial [Planctomycetota bacterium]